MSNKDTQDTLGHFDIDIPFSHLMNTSSSYATVRVFFDVVLQRAVRVEPVKVDDDLSRKIADYVGYMKQIGESDRFEFDSTLLFTFESDNHSRGFISEIAVIGDVYEALEVLVQYRTDVKLEELVSAEQTLQRAISSLSYVENRLIELDLLDLSKHARSTSRELEELLRNIHE